MGFISQKRLEVLQDAGKVLQGHTSTLNPEERATAEAFCLLLEELQEENNAHREKTRKAMQRSRSTPEGKEKDRIRRKKANKNYYEKKKAERQAEKE